MKQKSFFLVMLLFLAAFTACSGKEEQADNIPEVIVDKITIKDVPIEGEWMATIEGNTNAKIRAQVEGYLIKQNYSEGGSVKKGDVLFEIDPRPFEAALKKAESEYEQTLSRWKTAKADLQKIEPLAKISAISKRDLDNARGKEESTAAEVEAAKAAVETAKLNLDFTKVKAPIDGLVGVANAQIGDLVGSVGGQELTTMSDIDPVRVYIPVSEKQYLATVNDYEKNGEEAEDKKYADMDLHLILSDDTVYPEVGKLMFADRQIDSSTGTLKVAALFPNPKGILRPGLSARVRTVVDTEKNAYLVPKYVITDVQGIQSVLTVDKDGIVRLKNVKLGQAIGDMQIVATGLEKDDLIIVGQARGIKAGMQVIAKRKEQEQKEEPAVEETKAE